MTAGERPPHLCTIVPVASPFVGVDFPMRNNIAPTYLMQWLTLVSGRTSQEKMVLGNQLMWGEHFRRWFESGAAFNELDTSVGNPSPIFQQWIRHPRQDSYWDRQNLTAEQYSSITIPVLTVTGSYDADQPGALAHYREHRYSADQGDAPHHYLVIGPWDHAGTRMPQANFAGIAVGSAGLLDLARLHLDWYRWILCGGDRPAFLRQAVAYYVTSAETWRYAESLDAITAEHRTYYLDSQGRAGCVFASGALRDQMGSGVADVFIHDPRDIRLGELEAGTGDPLSLRPTFPSDNLRNQRIVIANDGRHCVYHSPP
jgi:hypothetical protein